MPRSGTGVKRVTWDNVHPKLDLFGKFQTGLHTKFTWFSGADVLKLDFAAVLDTDLPHFNWANARRRCPVNFRRGIRTKN